MTIVAESSSIQPETSAAPISTRIVTPVNWAVSAGPGERRCGSRSAFGP